MQEIAALFVVFGEHTAAVVVAEEGVLEQWHEADRCGCIGIRARRAGQVEQFAAIGGDEADEFGAERFEHFAQFGEARPALHIGDAGWAIGREVAADQRFARDRALMRGGQPVVDAGQQWGVAGAPDAGGRNLDQRIRGLQQHGHGQRFGSGEALGEALAELAGGHRFGVEQRTGQLQHLGLVVVAEALPEVALPDGAEEGLHQRADADQVVGSVKVQCAAHGGGAGQSAVDDQRGQPLVGEAVQPRPQADIRIVRLLCLHAEQPGNRLGDAHVAALEQQLAGEGGAVELAVGQSLSHRRLLGIAIN